MLFIGMFEIEKNKPNLINLTNLTIWNKKQKKYLNKIYPINITYAHKLHFKISIIDKISKKKTKTNTTKQLNKIKTNKQKNSTITELFFYARI